MNFDQSIILCFPDIQVEFPFSLNKGHILMPKAIFQDSSLVMTQDLLLKSRP